MRHQRKTIKVSGSSDFRYSKEKIDRLNSMVGNIYSVEHILALVYKAEKIHKHHTLVILDGVEVAINSKTMKTAIDNNFRCSIRGKEATHFIIDNNGCSKNIPVLQLISKEQEKFSFVIRHVMRCVPCVDEIGKEANKERAKTF